ncbi:MAG: molecular chaperone TorD family protein [Chloroflexi bacterium]|nr:molecular chaperone TorD family protein [Chloroflexota bacterium]
MTAIATATLMARARLAHLLAQGFAYPDAAQREALASGEYLGELGALAGALGLEAALPALEAALGEGTGTDLSRLEGEHTYLFQRNVLCPLNGSSYGRNRGLGAIHDLADVASFYGVFGFQVSSQAKELADHLCVELEFLGALCAKEVYAREQGWQERAEVCADARARFVAEHLAPWLPQLAARVREHARLRFYPALAAVAEAAVALETAPTNAAEGAGR